MVVVLIATPIVGVAFVLVWRWQTNKWARTERQQLHHPDDYEGTLPNQPNTPGQAPQSTSRIVVRDDNSPGPPPGPSL